MAESNSIKSSGIYVIRCIPSGRVYVGSAICIIERWYSHRKELKAMKHGNSMLQNAWQKYGPESFIFEVLEYCSLEQLLIREQHHMDVLRSYDRQHGFNLSPIAGSCLGVKHSEAARANMSAAHLGKKQSEELITKRAAANRGKKRSEETKAMMSAARLGNKHSEETKAKLRGKKHSAETLAKMAAANLGKKQTDETIAKRAAALRGQKRSEETRARMSAAQRGEKHSCWGKKQSEETKAKRAAALRGQKRSAEQCANLSKALRGIPKSQEHRERMSEIRKAQALLPGARAKASKAQTKISDEQFTQILTMLSEGKGGTETARASGVTPSQICDIRKGRKHQDRVRDCLDASPELAAAYNRHLEETSGGSVVRTRLSYARGQVTDDILLKILKMFIDGATCEAVSLDLDIPLSVIHTIKCRTAYKHRVARLLAEFPELERGLDKQGLSDEVLLRVVQMMAQGTAGIIIAKEIGMSPQTICYIKKSATYQKRIRRILETSPILSEAFSRLNLF